MNTVDPAAAATHHASSSETSNPSHAPGARLISSGPLEGLASPALPSGKRAVHITGTYAEHSARAQRLLGRHFDEPAFRAAVSTVPADPTARERAVDEHIWTRLAVLPAGSLELIGRGYAQVAYTNGDESPKEVTKINVFSMFQSAQWQWLFGRGGNDEIPDSIWRDGQHYAQRENDAYREMAGYFPDGAVPAQTSAVEKVAVRGDVLRFLLQRRAGNDDRRVMPVLDPSEIYHVPALVRTQAFVPEAARQDVMHFSLSWRNLEEIGISPDERDLYRMASETWVMNRKPDFDERIFRYCVSGTKLEALYVACLHDVRRRERVRDFVSRAIDYLNDKRTFLDIGGDGNAIFGESDYVLPDIFPGIVRAAEIAERTLARIIDREPISNLDRRRTVFALNDFRAFNAIAHALDISERAELFSPASVPKRSPDWDRIATALRPPIRRPWASSSQGRPERVEPVVFPVPYGPWGF